MRGVPRIDIKSSNFRVVAELKERIAKVSDNSSTGKTLFYNAVMDYSKLIKSGIMQSNAIMGMGIAGISGENEYRFEYVKEVLSYESCIILVDEGDIIFAKNKELLDIVLSNRSSYYVLFMRGVYGNFPVTIYNRAVMRIDGNVIKLLYYEDIKGW